MRLVVARNGSADFVAKVKYRTVDDTATEGDRDFVAIFGGEIIFNIGQTEAAIFVTVLDDNVPEPDEIFYIELFDAEGKKMKNCLQYTC